MDKQPLKNLRDVLSMRKSETNFSLRAVAHEGPFAPYGETAQAKAKMDDSPLAKESIRELPKGVVRDYGRIRIKNQSSQFVANSSVHTMHGQVIKDVPENDGPTTAPYKGRPLAKRRNDRVKRDDDYFSALHSKVVVVKR